MKTEVMKFSEIDLKTGRRSTTRKRVPKLPDDLHWKNIAGTKDWECTNSPVPMKVTLIGELTEVAPDNFSDRGCQWMSSDGHIYDSFGGASNRECSRVLAEALATG